MELTTLLGTLYLAAASFVCLLGLVLFRENPAQRLNRISALMLFLAGLGAFLGATDFLVQTLRPEGTFVFGDLVRNFAYLWEFFFPTLVLFAAVFPQPRSWVEKHRSVPWLLYAPHTFHFVLLLGVSLTGPDFGLPALAKAAPILSTPAALVKVLLELVYRAHRSLFAFVNLAYALAAMGLLGQSFLRARNSRLRRQLRVICIGLGVSLALYIAALPLPALVGWVHAKTVESSLMVLGLLAGGFSIAYAIVRHRFLDAQLIARRSILYGVVAVIVVLAYLVVVKPIGSFVDRFTGTETALFETVFVVLALLIFQPIVGRMEVAVDRYLIGDRADHRRVLETLSRDVVTILERQQLAERLLQALTEGVLASRATLLARDNDNGDFHVLAHMGKEGGRDEERSLRAVARRLPVERSGVLRPEELLALFEEGEEDDWAETCLSLLDTDLLVPLRHGEEMVGILLLGPKLTATRYTVDEVLLLETLGNQTAVALKNASLHEESLARAAMEEELAVARQIQQATLPTAFPDLHPFQVGGVNIPSRHVGGDYYDLILLPDGRFLFAIADVSGKGVPAALLMSMLQASLRTQAGELRSVRDVVARLNRLVHQSTTTDRFATLFLGLVDPAAMTVTFTNAGHDPPIVQRAGGETSFCHCGGLLLGMMENPPYEEETIELRAGDRLVLFTDGVTEARNESDVEFGVGRLLEALARSGAGEPPGQTLTRIIAEVQEFAREGEAMDDVTIVVLRVDPGLPAASAGAVV